jgi:hypothetical protein
MRIELQFRLLTRLCRMYGRGFRFQTGLPARQRQIVRRQEVGVHGGVSCSAVVAEYVIMRALPRGEREMVTAISLPNDVLSYEDYLSEGYVEGRYDIVEGVRISMPGATWEHQRTAGNLYNHFRQYERSSGKGLALFAPFDVLIRRLPRLQTRQPDLLFISHEQLA